MNCQWYWANSSSWFGWPFGISSFWISSSWSLNKSRLSILVCSNKYSFLFCLWFFSLTQFFVPNHFSVIFIVDRTISGVKTIWMRLKDGKWTSRFPAPLVTLLNELWGTLLGSYIYKWYLLRYEFCFILLTHPVTKKIWLPPLSALGFQCMSLIVA